MKDEEALLRTLRSKLTGLHECISELETSEEDLLTALGARNHDAGEIALDLPASEIEQFLVGLAKTVDEGKPDQRVVGAPAVLRLSK